MRLAIGGPSALLLAALASGCGGAEPTEPSAPITIAYQITWFASRNIAHDDDFVTWEVELIVRASHGGPVPGAVVRMRVTDGSLASETLIANDYGTVYALWTRFKPEPSSSSLQACATNPADAPCTYQDVW